MKQSSCSLRVRMGGCECGSPSPSIIGRGGSCNAIAPQLMFDSNCIDIVSSGLRVRVILTHTHPSSPSPSTSKGSVSFLIEMLNQLK